jgi:multidrug efflux pump subunit AcrA (membrane-fusion protein)
MITVMDVSQIVARAHVSQEEVSRLKVGDSASLVLPDGGAPVPGKVTVISPALDPVNTTVEVWVQAANTADRLKPGTSVRVEMVVESLPSALVIPQASVLTSPSGNKSVIVIDSKQTPRKVVRSATTVTFKPAEGFRRDRVVTVGALSWRSWTGVLAKTRFGQPRGSEDEDEQ